MTDLRKAAEMALYALLDARQVMDITYKDKHAYADEIAALRQALLQDKQDSETYGYAKYLAECIWEKHYKEESPHWRPSDNTLSVLTQIDNMTCGLEKAQPDTTSDFATRSADSAESFCKQELHNLMSVAGRMALELECLLLDTKDLSVVSKWWDSGMESLQAYRDYIWSITHGKDEENSSTCQSCGKFLGTEWIIHTCTTTISEPVKERISEPVENLEPILWIKDNVIVRSNVPEGYTGVLYTAPPKREWVHLTSEHIEFLKEFRNISITHADFRAIEAFIEMKNDNKISTPQKREWVGLTDWERRHYNNRLSGSGVAEEIEAKLKERQL